MSAVIRAVGWVAALVLLTYLAALWLASVQDGGAHPAPADPAVPVIVQQGSPPPGAVARVPVDDEEEQQAPAVVDEEPVEEAPPAVSVPVEEDE